MNGQSEPGMQCFVDGCAHACLIESLAGIRHQYMPLCAIAAVTDQSPKLVNSCIAEQLHGCTVASR